MQSSVFCCNLLQEQTSSQALDMTGSSSLSPFLTTEPIPVLCSPREPSKKLAFCTQRIRYLSLSLSKMREMVSLSLHIYFDSHPNQARFYSGQLSEQADDATHKFQLFILRPFKEEKQHTLIISVFKKQKQLQSAVTNSKQTLLWKALQYTAPQDTVKALIHF